MNAGGPETTPTWFVICCAERTGSNLLVSMLRSHPEIGAAGEIFNGRHLDDPIPWPPVWDRDDLVALRKTDKNAMLAELGQIATGQRLGAFGFKLMYYQAERNPEVVDFLQGIPDLRVIHIKRHNRLRRFLSHTRAQQSDKWKNSAKDGARKPAPRPVHIDFRLCVRDYLVHMNKERLIDETFANKSIHHVSYEDLESDPQSVAVAVLDFLGLPPRDLELGERKTGTDPLKDAIRNHDELRAMFASWVSYFDN